jgi:hypothetical protein
MPKRPRSDEPTSPIRKMPDGSYRTLSVARAQEGSFLVADNKEMERIRRRREQSGERQFGTVHEKEHRNDSSSPEESLDNGLMEHPYFKDRQNYDGVDPTVNPIPALNTEARREYDNELRLQHQKKLQNNPNYNPASTPKPGFN